MGILDRIKQAFTPRPSPTLDDPQFGRIVFCDPDSWETAYGHEREVTFAPTQARVDFTVSGDERGPSSQVRELYRELQRRYAELIPSIAPLLRDDSSTAILSDGPVSDQAVLDSFEFLGIAIYVKPDDPEPKIVLTYSPEWRWEMLIDVTIRNWQAVHAEGYD